MLKSRQSYDSMQAIVRFIRKFADSSNGADTIEKADRLVRHMGTSPTEEFLATISELAYEP